MPGGEFNVDIVVDASYCIYGRLASKIASEALEGWSIAVVNVEDTIITGNPENTIEKFQTRRDIGSDQGPIYPKQPHRLFKRSVRGMLPYKTQRGGEALQRIRAYKQNPYEIDGLKLDGTKAKSPIKNHTYLKEVSKKLG
ncbi:50S ribosomal protein L13 [Halorubrum ezzemoulense]|uniref:50S ribosomal protein L13 n=1 Tax=Halorubrum ezzemoulense TaxID=337243 RepID=UPI003CCB801F